MILPRLEADGVGIETVNVEKLNISVYRVSDRSLARKSVTRGESFGEDDYYYAYDEESGEDVGVKVFDKDIKVNEVENETVTTVFALGAALPKLYPGAYFVRLKDATPGRRRKPPRASLALGHVHRHRADQLFERRGDRYFRALDRVGKAACRASISNWSPPNNDILARGVERQGRARAV